jgi:hypothetical protein
MGDWFGDYTPEGGYQTEINRVLRRGAELLYLYKH